MELAEIEKRIAEYEEEGWQIEKIKERFRKSDYHLGSPSGEVFESYYLQRNICPLCADEEEHNSGYENEDSEESEEERWCDGSLHDQKYIKDLEAAEKLYRLIQARDNIKISRLVLEGK